MAETLRTFVAIELTDGLHAALDDLEQNVKRIRASGSVKWVAPGNIHLTLKFLGNVDSARLPDLEHALAAACAGQSQFELTLGGIGAFPNLNRPNVIWVGLAGQVQEATLLAEGVESECARIGFAREERPFSPHLTIGRVRRETKPADRALLGEGISRQTVGELGSLVVDRLSLMKSELTPRGSIYTRLAAVPFTVGQYRSVGG